MRGRSGGGGGLSPIPLRSLGAGGGNGRTSQDDLAAILRELREIRKLLVELNGR
jgi:hypothetical protein